MELFAGERIALVPRSEPKRVPALQAAFLGHCPKGGRGVRVSRLLGMRSALELMRSAGYGLAVDRLEEMNALESAAEPLYNLPIPLHSSAEFHDIFPDAAVEPTRYVSLLAGNSAWLPRAVDDFFANGGERLWVVSVSEELGYQGFLPDDPLNLLDAESLTGIDTVLAIPEVGLIALPDLERLCIPASLPDVKPITAARPEPAFLPCAVDAADGASVYRYTPGSGDPLSLGELTPFEVLQRLIGRTVRERPDIQCLWTVPLNAAEDHDGPTIHREHLAEISNWADSAWNGTGDGHLLRHVQLLFPFLRSARYSLRSPVGIVAGKQAESARNHGTWKSIAGTALRTEGLPYPPVSLAQTLALRREPGIGILRSKITSRGNIEVALDDERLAVPSALHADYARTRDRSRWDGYRSAEVMRFLGFLRRQLVNLGNDLVFNVDPSDPRPRLLLERFFRKLHGLGALRGAQPEHGFFIRESSSQEGVMQFDIEIAPAFPIDRLVLTFTNVSGEWRSGVIRG